MPKFIATDRVAISDDAGNTVWVRRRMDLGAVSRVQGAKQGEQLIALYVANILAWQGPDFKGMDCTPENIEKLDPNDPFWEQVATRIAELNKREDVDPLALTTVGGVVTTAQIATSGAHPNKYPSGTST